MIPLNDTEPNRYGVFPFMTMTIIIVNLLVLAVEYLFLESDWHLLVEMFYRYGSVPTLILDGEGGGALTSVTSTFLHGGLGHLGGNMLFLWAFGRRVEDACGPWRFLIFYLLCGVTADMTSTLVHAGEFRPSVGASGAIFGVMGAYMLLFPGGRIRTFLLLFLVPLFPRVRAFWIILYYFLSQLLSIYAVMAFDVDYSVNYWAHLGGFFGSLLIFFFLRPEAYHRYRKDLPV